MNARAFPDTLTSARAKAVLNQIASMWSSRRSSLFAMACVAGLSGHCASVAAQGQYSAVTTDDVVALKFNHYFRPNNKALEPDFEWTFTPTEFVMKRAAGPIPDDLQKRLLPAGRSADEIRGRWKLVDRDGQQLVLTEIKAGEQPGNKVVILVIYKTAPTVVRIGEPQYVFGIGM